MALGPDSRFSLRTQPMTRAEAEAAGIDVGLREYMLKVYNYMTSGLLLTGIVAYIGANTPAILNALYAQGPQGLQPTLLAWIVMLSPLAFIFALSFGINRIQASTAQAIFWVSKAVRPTKMPTPITEIANCRAELARNRLTRLAMMMPIRPMNRNEPNPVRSRLVV